MRYPGGPGPVESLRPSAAGVCGSFQRRLRPAATASTNWSSAGTHAETCAAAPRGARPVAPGEGLDGLRSTGLSLQAGQPTSVEGSDDVAHALLRAVHLPSDGRRGLARRDLQQNLSTANCTTGWELERGAKASQLFGGRVVERKRGFHPLVCAGRSHQAPCPRTRLPTEFSSTKGSTS